MKLRDRLRARRIIRGMKRNEWPYKYMSDDVYEAEIAAVKEFGPWVRTVPDHRLWQVVRAGDE